MITPTTQDGTTLSSTLNTLFGGILNTANQLAPSVAQIAMAREQAKINERNARAQSLTALPVAVSPGTELRNNIAIDGRTAVYIGAGVVVLIALVVAFRKSQ